MNMVPPPRLGRVITKIAKNCNQNVKVNIRALKLLLFCQLSFNNQLIIEYDFHMLEAYFVPETAV